MTGELLPCPFCGGIDDIQFEEYNNRNSGDFEMVRSIYCESCGGRVWSDYASKAEAIAAWNRRPAPEGGDLVDCFTGDCSHDTQVKCTAAIRARIASLEAKVKAMQRSAELGLGLAEESDRCYDHLKAERDALEAEVARLVEGKSVLYEKCATLRTERDALRARVETLEGALEPCADSLEAVASLCSSCEVDNHGVMRPPIAANTVARWRQEKKAARAALQREGEQA